MSFQKLIDGFTKKEFKLQTKRTTKLAKWGYLTKEGGFFSFRSDGVFLYFVDGDVKIEHMNDFVNRLIKYYDGEALDSKDIAIFAHSGNLNSKEFRRLAKNSMIEEAYKIIKIKKVKRARAITKTIRKGLAKAQKTLILRSQHFKCAMCKTDISKISPHFDHRIPIAMGGSDTITNIQALCGTCHTEKTKFDKLEISRARKRR